MATFKALPSNPQKSSLVSSSSDRYVIQSVRFLARRASNSSIKMRKRATCCSAAAMCPKTVTGEKLVWIWTEKKQVMTAAVERCWNTFIFPSSQRDLAAEWSSLSFISPFIIEEGEVFEAEDLRVGVYKDVSSPPQLEKIQSLNEDQLIIVHLHDWQRILLLRFRATIQCWLSPNRHLKLRFFYRVQPKSFQWKPL